VKRIAADLHIHMALSPCGQAEMTPPAIVRAAIESGLDMIAICDHNTAGNTAATQEAAGSDIAVLAGMEITTAEEVHVVGLFPSSAAARAAADEVRTTLPELGDESRGFGGQPLMDAGGRVVGHETKMLAAASGLDLSEALDLIRRHGGLAIAAHVDRPSFSVISQLGMFPPDVVFDAIEISVAGTAAGREAGFAYLRLPMVASSDSHFLADVGSCCTKFELLEATFDELALALKGIGGRRRTRA
jgi:hypothetical protein